MATPASLSGWMWSASNYAFSGVTIPTLSTQDPNATYYLRNNYQGPMPANTETLSGSVYMRYNSSTYWQTSNNQWKFYENGYEIESSLIGHYSLKFLGGESADLRNFLYASGVLWKDCEVQSSSFTFDDDWHNVFTNLGSVYTGETIQYGVSTSASSKPISWLSTNPQVKNAGTYYGWIKVVNSEKSTSCEILVGQFTISKKNDVLTNPTLASGLEYTGYEQQLITGAGSTEGGAIVQYKVDSGSWTTDYTEVKKYKAGTYTIYVKTNGTSNYNAIAETSVGTVTIAKKAPQWTINTTTVSTHGAPIFEIQFASAAEGSELYIEIDEQYVSGMEHDGSSSVGYEQSEYKATYTMNRTLYQGLGIGTYKIYTAESESYARKEVQVSITWEALIDDAFINFNWDNMISMFPVEGRVYWLFEDCWTTKAYNNPNVSIDLTFTYTSNVAHYASLVPSISNQVTMESVNVVYEPNGPKRISGYQVLSSTLQSYDYPLHIDWNSVTISTPDDFNNGYRGTSRNISTKDIPSHKVLNAYPQAASTSLDVILGSNLRCAEQHLDIDLISYIQVRSGNFNEKLPGNYTLVVYPTDLYWWYAQPSQRTNDITFNWEIKKLNLEYQPYVNGEYRIPATYQNNQWQAINPKVR